MTAKVELLTPSGGKVILDPTDTAVDRVLTLPAVAGTVLNTASNIEAQVKTATSATGSAPIFSCRAWVNFNGTGAVAIRASGNVSSITDNGTGDYTVNFTTAMVDANYCVTAILPLNGANSGNDSLLHLNNSANPTASFFRVANSSIFGTTKTVVDNSLITIAIFR